MRFPVSFFSKIKFPPQEAVPSLAWKEVLQHGWLSPPLHALSPQMSLTFDDQFLLTVAEDGCLFTWKVFDKDGRGIKREREVGFAEEVLVTKTDMEEKVRIGSSEKGQRTSLPGCPKSWDQPSSPSTAWLHLCPAQMPTALCRSPPTPPCCPCCHRILSPPYPACHSATWSS